jgi:uncharacterized protein YdiU (UPF0061 family)
MNIGSLLRQHSLKSRLTCIAATRLFIPRNHRVEAVIEAAVTREDFAPFNELMTVLSAPYEEQPAFATYAAPPPPNQRVYRTFCGT